MDAKLTLAFDQAVIERTKLFAEKHDISLSRLTEFLYRKLTESPYTNLEDLPISDWVHLVAEGEIEYKTQTKSRKALKDEYFSSKK